MRKIDSNRTGRVRLAAIAPVLLAALLTTAGPSALAQSDYGAAAAPQNQPPAPDPNEPPKRRLDRLEREVNEVRQIVLQARATGHPVEIKEAGPDPEIVSLQARLDDIENTLRGQTGQIEVLGHDLALAKQSAADAKAAAASLADRLDKLEKQVAALTTPPPPPAPPADEASVPMAGGASGGPGGEDPKAAYAQAHKLMLDGDYAGAATAYQAYIDRHGDQPNMDAAHYWLGFVKYAQEDYAGAASAFIAAIRGWPKTPWAPDAVVKLSLSLTKLNKPDDACATLAELRRRYPRAPAATKARAAAASALAQCAR
jgi:tol-pal system protein YbgF